LYGYARVRILQDKILIAMNQFISLQDAINMTTQYRSNRENVLKTQYQNIGLLPLSEAFNRLAFDTVLAEDGCEGLRIYYGMGDDLKVHAIIVGTDANGNDILPQRMLTAAGNDASIIENGTRCPDICPDPSPLNT
jgi:hypothetical protein